jgi:hypothetical protein
MQLKGLFGPKEQHKSMSLFVQHFYELWQKTKQQQQ